MAFFADSIPEREINQLALDMVHHLIFSDRHLHEPDIRTLSMVFMPLMFMNEKQVAELGENPPGLIYEYLSKAGPRSCNGMPMFFSCLMLSQSDAAKVMTKYKAVIAAEKAALGEPEEVGTYEDNDHDFVGGAK